MLLFQHVHQIVDGELSEEVGAPAGVGADAGGLDVQLLGLGYDLGPTLHFLHLRAVGVAAYENVTHVAIEPRIGVSFDGERG